MKRKQWPNLREDSRVKGTNEPAVPAVLFLSDMRWLELKGSPNPCTHSVLDEKSLSTPFILSQNVKKKKKKDSSVELLCVCNGSIQSIVFLKPRFSSAMWSYRFTFCFHAWSISFLFKILNDVALTYNWHYMKWLSLCIWHYNYNICAYM